MNEELNKLRAQRLLLLDHLDFAGSTVARIAHGIRGGKRIHDNFDVEDLEAAIRALKQISDEANKIQLKIEEIEADLASPKNVEVATQQLSR